MVATIPSIDYNLFNLDQVKLETRTHERTGKVSISNMEVNGQETQYTDRFGISLAALYGFSPSIFNYFQPDEVIARICERKPDQSWIRLTEEVDEGGDRRALAVSRPARPVLRADSLQRMLLRRNGEGVSYENGVFTSWHKPAVGGDVPVEIGNDTFKNRFTMEIPIDGYGRPNAYISMLREICSNGMVGYSKAFRSSIQIGNRSDAEPFPVMERFIESFNNEEGFIAIKQRMGSALRSPASLNELYSLYQTLNHTRMASINRKIGGERTVADKLWDLGGDIARIYGLVNMDSLSAKKRAHIPAACSVYDLVNFSTEVATHYATPDQGRKLQSWVGTTISNEYDLEGTLEEDEEPQDLFLMASGHASMN